MVRNKMLCVVLAVLMLLSCMVGCGGKNGPSVSVSDGKTSPNYSPNNINDNTEKDVVPPENEDPAIIEGTTISKEPAPENPGDQQPTPELPPEETDNPEFTNSEDTEPENPKEPTIEKPDGEPVYYKDLHPQEVVSTTIKVDINKTEDYKFSFINDFSYDEGSLEETFQQVTLRIQDESKAFLDIDNAIVTTKFYPPKEGQLSITRAKDKTNSNITYQIDSQAIPNYVDICIGFYIEEFDNNVASRISEILKDYFGIVISEFDIRDAKKSLDNLEITESTTGTVVQSYSRDNEIGFSIFYDFNRYCFSTGISNSFDK